VRRGVDARTIFASFRRLAPQEDPMKEESHGKVDLASILYILGGIPSIVLFLWVIFSLARYLDFPA
jgi:hypothetical protein